MLQVDAAEPVNDIKKCLFLSSFYWFSGLPYILLTTANF